MPDIELSAEEKALIADHRAKKLTHASEQARIDEIMAKKGQLSADELEILRKQIVVELTR